MQSPAERRLCRFIPGQSLASGESMAQARSAAKWRKRRAPTVPLAPFINAGLILGLVVSCFWRDVVVAQVSVSAQSSAVAQVKASEEGFESVFNGHDFTGWAGPTNDYEIVDGAIQCRPNKGGTIYTVQEYEDFVVRLEMRMPKGGNNGLAIRYPGWGDTAYVGMCEIQVLDDHYEQATGEKIDPRQADGSAYGMIAAKRGYQKPNGEWNFEQVTVKGSKIKVELNGTVILDCDLSTVTKFMADHPHPGKDRTKGYFGFAGHNDPVAFRNIRIKRL
jgi:hypothetical protein